MQSRRIPFAPARAAAAAVLALAPWVSSAAPPQNVLVIVWDDVGIPDVGAYGEGTDPASTPVFDAVAAAGVRFTRAYSNPVCSPTRACIQTGRYSFRTGIGVALGPGSAWSLQLAETILPEALPSHSAAFLGKWHLGLADDLTHPNASGWPRYAGSLWNLEGVGDYFNWVRVEDGVAAVSTRYATTDTVDSAIAWISTAVEPWVCFLSFNAAHAPFHDPPPELVGPPPPPFPMRGRFKDMIEASDVEVGRLLSFVGPLLDRTTVLWTSDNGTPGSVLSFGIPPHQAKGQIFEGGIRVPLVVAGAGVAAPAGSECAALVNLTDLFATILELAGAQAPASGRDSVSLRPYLSDPALPSIRGHYFAEWFRPNGHGLETEWRRAIGDGRWKLVRRHDRPDALYDLASDPHEQHDVLAGSPMPDELRRHRRLRRAMRDLMHR